MHGCTSSISSHLLGIPIEICTDAVLEIIFKTKQDMILNVKIALKNRPNQERLATFLCVVKPQFCVRELKQTRITMATRTPPNRRFHELRTIAAHVLYCLGIFLCHSLLNNKVKWLSAAYFGEREHRWLIRSIFIWN